MVAGQDPQPHQAVPFEILPFDEMPKLVNPVGGYFINANNDPTGNTRDNNAFNEMRPGGGFSISILATRSALVRVVSPRPSTNGSRQDR